jgi:hypothetical protein
LCKSCSELIDIDSCPEADVEGPEANIEGPEASADAPIEGPRPEIDDRWEPDGRLNTPDSRVESIKCKSARTCVEKKLTKYLVIYGLNEQNPED